MADEPPSTPCRWRGMTVLVRIRNKIREKLWVSQVLNDPDLHMGHQSETESASTSNHPQHYYDASSQAFQAPAGDLLSQMLYLEETSVTTPREPEAAGFITLADLGIENQMDHRSSSHAIYGMAEDFYLDADCDMQEYDESQSSLQHGWSAPPQLLGGEAEMVDTGDSQSSSAVEWQRIRFLQQFLEVDGAVRAGPGWNVVLKIVSVFKRITGLIRRRQQERVVENQFTPRRIRSAEVTRYKGIRPRNGKWVSEIRIGGTHEKVWLGSYNTEKEAALAFDAGKHHCSLRRSRGFNFTDSPRLLGAPQRFNHLSSVERRAKIQRLAEDHARAYASADIR